MQTKKLLTQALAVFALSATASAFAAVQTLDVSILGPGGHSNGNYGNTNAVHAAARAIMHIGQELPDALISNMKGGVSVNAIAADCGFTVTLQGDASSLQKQIQTVKQAVAQGCAEENQFRHVQEGDLVRGVPAQIRYSVK